MILTVLLLFLGLCAAGSTSAVAQAARQHLLQTSSALSDPAPLRTSDLIIVYTTTRSRLALVHATRPARRGVRTVIVLQDASAVAELNKLYGGVRNEYNETYIAWAGPGTGASARNNGGPYGRTSAQPTHPLHLIGPTWAMAPLLAHIAVQASSSTGPQVTSTSTSMVSSLPYRWMLLARDDTLWRPIQAVKLLSQYDDRVAAAVSDHLVDFNGYTILAPSAAAAVCLPCGFNLTELLGRRHPPGVPQPACPVCRPAGGCEFRFDLCSGLVGGPHCGSKRFLGSGDRCAHSWVAGGAGVALSATLLSYLDQMEWAACVQAQRPSTGERTLGRCLWRNGFSFTHPAAGLAEMLTKEVFSAQHMLFGNPWLRQEIFGTKVDEVLMAAYNAEAAAVTAAAAAAAAAATTTSTAKSAASAAAAPFQAGSSTEPAAAAATSIPASTRLVASTNGKMTECDNDCRQWLMRSGVSVHLDVPYAESVDVAAAAAVLAAAAKGSYSVAKGPK